MKAEQLKASILNMAFQGKLTEQLDSDSSVDELLEKIKAEKQKLINEGKLKKEKELAPITAEDIPFDIPDTWRFVKVGTIAIQNPRTVAEDTTNVSFIPMKLVADGYSNHHDAEIMQWKKVKTNYSSFANGDIGIAKITPCFQNRKSAIFKNLCNGIGAGTTELTILRPNTVIINPEFLLWLFKTQNFINKGVESFTGTAGQQRVHKDFIKNYLVPLPPLEEQQRIVEKLNDLLPLADEYGKYEQELSALNLAFPDKAKQSILQEAIQGKLVPQMAKEGVVEQIGVAPKGVPFEIPESWKWVPLSSLGKTHTGTTPSTSTKEYFGNDIPFVKPGDIDRCLITYRGDGLSSVAREVARLVPEDSLLMVCIGGSIGKVAVCDREVSFNQQINAIACDEKFSRSAYLFVVMRSSYFQDVVRRNATGTTTPIINKSRWGKLLIPLPPVEEQDRIVAKVEELLKQVDALSAQ